MYVLFKPMLGGSQFFIHVACLFRVLRPFEKVYQVFKYIYNFKFKKPFNVLKF